VAFPSNASEFSFERFYRNTPPPTPEKTRKRKLNYALVTLAVLLLVLAILGWRERDLARYGVQQVTEWAKARVAEYAARQESEPVHSSSKSTRPVARRSSRFIGETVVVVNEPPVAESVLPISVQGQPSTTQPITTSLLTVMAPGKHPQLIRTPISPLRFRVAPRESLAMLLHQVAPVYPLAAKAANIEGPVALRVVIGTDGNVQAVSPLSGDPVLIPAAIEAVKQWQYRPRYVDGTPAEVETDVILQFSLAEDARAQMHPLSAR
jgi:TonB family protein